MQLRDYLPKTLFGRMLSIILVPMILVQVITIFIFYERHWDTVTRHMASQLAAEIELLALLLLCVCPRALSPSLCSTIRTASFPDPMRGSQTAMPRRCCGSS